MRNEIPTRVARRDVCLWIGTTLWAGCTRSSSPGDGADDASETPAALNVRLARDHDRSLKAVASVGMVADLVHHVGGDRVTVRPLMGAGVDPHLYRATRDDVRMILSADVVFYSGLMLEGKLDDTFRKVGRTRPVRAITDSLPRSLLLSEGEEGSDPHVWMDVGLWSRCLPEIVGELTRLDPAGAATFRRGADQYAMKLEQLHDYGRRVIGSIDPSRRLLITSHDAFRYFGRAYQLEVMGVQGLSTDSEAGLRRVNDLVNMLVRQRIAAVFVESSVPRKSIEAIVAGAASRDHVVEIGGELFSDAMGPSGSYEGTYIGMMDHNMTRIARALGGTAPHRGMLGKLEDSTRTSEISS